MGEHTICSKARIGSKDSRKPFHSATDKSKIEAIKSRKIFFVYIINLCNIIKVFSIIRMHSNKI